MNRNKGQFSFHEIMPNKGVFEFLLFAAFRGHREICELIF